MKKIFFFASILAGLVLTLLATIITDPASGTINVGASIGAQIDCLDYVACNMFWGDGTVTGGNDDDFYFNFRYHVYRNPGTFTMHFRRYSGPDSFCPLNEYKTVIVRETRSITMSPEKPSVGQVVRFTAVGFKTPGDITWDMGDGKTYKHNKSSITHTYAKAGKYTVRAFDWKGDTTTTPVSLAITVAEPMRMITFMPAAPRVDQEVSLQAVNFASASIDWNFGDGTPQQTYSPAVAHRYQNPGAFIITAVEHGMNLAPATQAISILPENRSLSLSAQEARADEPITVTAVNFRGPQVLWDFGDGSTASGPGTMARAGRAGGISGPTTMTHAYRLPGSYTITARDENGASQKTFKAQVKILGISDQVNLEIAEIVLDNGKYYKVVPRNSKNIRALLRMKMKGTGIVSGYWVVDGQPFQFFNETVFQGQIKTIPTPEIPGLPVFDPGMHTITMQLTRPAGEGVVFPTLRYFVLPYENEIAVLAPKDGAIIKEDEVATFAWESALGGSYYQVAFASGIFPLMRNDESLAWHDCPERLRFTPDAETWKSIKRNEWTYWKVRAMDSGRLIMAESGVMEMKIIVPGAKIGIERITDLDGNGIAIGGGLASTRAERVLVHGGLTYPAEAEYLVLRVYANDTLVDQLLFRDVKQDEKRAFETSVPNAGPECRVVFQVLKSSSPSMLIGYAELMLKRE
jgi:PKD repeat protein